MKHDESVDEVLVRQIAGETLADIRTVRRVLRGERVRGIVGHRIARAIAARRVEVVGEAHVLQGAPS